MRRSVSDGASLRASAHATHKPYPERVSPQRTVSFFFLCESAVMFFFFFFIFWGWIFFFVFFGDYFSSKLQ